MVGIVKNYRFTAIFFLIGLTLVGHSGINGDSALRDAVDAGWIPGPRIQAATRKLVSFRQACARNWEGLFLGGIYLGSLFSSATPLQRR